MFLPFFIIKAQIIIAPESTIGLWGLLLSKIGLSLKVPLGSSPTYLWTSSPIISYINIYAKILKLIK